MFLDMNSKMKSLIDNVITNALMVSPILLVLNCGIFLVEPTLLTLGFAIISFFLYVLKYMHEKVILYINEIVPFQFIPPIPVEETPAMQEKNEIDRVENVTPMVRSRRRRRGSG